MFVLANRNINIIVILFYCFMAYKSINLKEDTTVLLGKVKAMILTETPTLFSVDADLAIKTALEYYLDRGAKHG